MANIVAAAGGGNWTAGGSWVGGSAPTAADNAILDATSGNITINSGAVCRSLDCTGYTGVLTHTAAVTLTVGDATAGASNIALKLVAGMTYTLGNATTSSITFVSTSATVQSLTFNGQVTGNLIFQGSGSSYQFQDALVASSISITLTRGTLDFNGLTHTISRWSSSNGNARTITLTNATLNLTGAGTASPTWGMDNVNACTLNSSGSILNFTGAGTQARFGGLSYGTVNVTGSGSFLFNDFGAAPTFVNFNRTGTAEKGSRINVCTSFTVTGILTLAGESVVNRLDVFSNSVGTARTITCNTTVTASNVDFTDITGSGTASWNLAAITGNSGDGGGNSGITFTTPATQTWSGTSGGNWSANAWTSRVPLPQDDVVIASAFAASQTITTDMPRFGKNIDFTGTTGTPTLTVNASIGNFIYGSLTLISGMAWNTSSTVNFSGRGDHILTSAGKNFAGSLAIIAPGGSYTLAGNVTSNSNFVVTAGTMDTDDFNITSNTFQSTGSITRSIILGTSTVSVQNTGFSGTPWNLSGSNITVSAASSTITYRGTDTTNRTFAGLSQAYGTFNNVVNGSTGAIIISGSNTFDTINFTDTTNARTLRFIAGTTTTILSTFNVNGTSGKLMSIDTNTAGTPATLTKSGGAVICDYISVKDSTATGGAAWFAGANSTNVSGNSGWLFSAPSIKSVKLVLLQVTKKISGVSLGAAKKISGVANT